MNVRDIADKLGTLVKLDIDASHCYKQAIDEIEDPEIRSQLAQFRADHDRHADDLITLIRDLGQTPPERSRDFKGFMLEGFTSIRSATGAEGALKAMHTNEKLTNKTYSDATTWDLTPAAISRIERNFQDEQRHIHYIEQALANRAWDKAGTRGGKSSY